MNRVRRLARWFKERVAPWPARLALDVLYFSVVVPYGVAWRLLRRAQPDAGTFWRSGGRVSDTFERARLRF